MYCSCTVRTEVAGVSRSRSRVKYSKSVPENKHIHSGAEVSIYAYFEIRHFNMMNVIPIGS